MEIKITDEFASAMQQLSAEAEKTLPGDASEEGSSGEQFAQILEEFRSLTAVGIRKGSPVRLENWKVRRRRVAQQLGKYST